MSSDTAENSVNVLLDTNILVSALVFGGKPERLLRLVIEKQINAITSPALLFELIEVLTKKFSFSREKAKAVEEKIKRRFIVVYPRQTISVLRDDMDNRVLEAALSGGCAFIITGDKELLELKEFKNIKIMTADQFLTHLEDITKGCYHSA